MPELLFQVNYSLNNIATAASKFWAQLDAYKVIVFSGQLGAGKTTFIHALCEQLEVKDAVSSPTFALINEYHFMDASGKDNTIFHMDWYRLRDADEAMGAGMEDCLLQTKNSNTYCFIEWPEKAEELLPAGHVWIKIDALNETERKMEAWLFNKD